LQKQNIPVYLVSGGFRCFVNPLAKALNIPVSANVFANTLLFTSANQSKPRTCSDISSQSDNNEELKFAGFDANELTSQSGGKGRVIQKLIQDFGYRNVVMVGDGATDLEAKPPATAVIGYGGIVIRPKVKAEADWFILDFKEITLLLKQQNV
jgi:phosphoserine phosphatase